jgi:amidase
MEFDQYIRSDCVDLLCALRTGQTNALALGSLARVCLERIRDWNAVAQVYRHSPYASGVLAGLPILHKDSYSGAICGLPLQFGSRLGEGHVAKHTSFFMQQLLDLGCQVVGRSTVPEFVISIVGDNAIFGSTSNPFNRAYTSGGSTAGVAALALGAVPVIQGADAGGSLRIPASWCGCYSIKPTRTHLRGLVSNCFGLDESFVATRSLRDLRLFQSLLSKNVEPIDLFALTEMSVNSGLQVSGKVGLCRRIFTDILVDEDQNKLLDKFLAKAKSLNIEVVEIDLQLPFDAYSELLFEIFTQDLKLSIDKLVAVTNRNAKEFLQPYVADWYELAAKLSYRSESCINLDISKFERAIDEAFSGYRYICSPVTARTPPKLDKLHPIRAYDPRVLNQSFEQIVHFCAAFNLSGHPAISVPFGRDRNRLPQGIQIVARKGKDAELIEFASLFDEGFSSPYFTSENRIS